MYENNKKTYNDLNLYKNCKYAYFLNHYKKENRNKNEVIEEINLLNSLLIQSLSNKFELKSKKEPILYKEFKFYLEDYTYLKKEYIFKFIDKFIDEIKETTSYKTLFTYVKDKNIKEIHFNYNIESNDFKGNINIFIELYNGIGILIKFKYGNSTSYDFENLDILSTILFENKKHIKCIYEYLYYPKEDFFHRKKILFNEIEPLKKSINLQIKHLNLINKNEEFDKNYNYCNQCFFKTNCEKIQKIEEYQIKNKEKFYLGKISDNFAIVYKQYKEEIYNKYLKDDTYLRLFMISNENTQKTYKKYINHLKDFISDKDCYIEKIVIEDISLFKDLFDVEINLTISELNKEVFELSLNNKKFKILFIDSIEENYKLIEYFKFSV